MCNCGQLAVYIFQCEFCSVHSEVCILQSAICSVNFAVCFLQRVCGVAHEEGLPEIGMTEAFFPKNLEVGEIWPLCLLSTADGTFARNRLNYCLQPPLSHPPPLSYLCNSLLAAISPPPVSSNMRAAPCDSGSRRRPSNLGGVKLTRGPREVEGGGHAWRLSAPPL